jgi:hypothetical protein
MDFMEGLIESNDKEVNFMVMDKFNKYASFIALTHLYLGTTMATVFIDHIYKFMDYQSV